MTTVDDKIIEKETKRKNIKELFADYEGEYTTPTEIDWGEPVGNEMW